MEAIIGIDHARKHPSAVDIGHGWLILADRNVFKKIFLVSKHQPVIIPFEHDEPYHSFLHAYMLAKMHAQNNAQFPSPEAAQVQELIYIPLVSTGDNRT